MAKWFSRLSVWFLAAALVVFLVAYAPVVSGAVKNTLGVDTSNFSLSSKEVNVLKATQKVQKPSYQPPFDPTLPKTNRLVIKSIGVDTPIQEATYDNYESALRKGVWRVSDFGAPGEIGTPTILAAHRYGYLSWSVPYRLKNSFYNLPKVKVGDTVEIDYQQKKYLYEVYAEDKGTGITDYSADLILYTCESLTGETRIFKYAKLLAI